MTGAPAMRKLASTFIVKTTTKSLKWLGAGLALLLAASLPAAGAAAQKARRPAAAPAPPPRPLHNRSAKAAVAEPGAERGGPDAARCSRIANRSRDLVRSHGISFDAAWRRAEAELGE